MMVDENADMTAGDDGELKVDEPEDVEEVAARLQQLRSLITERFLSKESEITERFSSKEGEITERFSSKENEIT